MQVNNINSTNFAGYKNVITNRAMAAKNNGFTFLSMQLDNVGHNDLEIWKNFQKNLFNKNNLSSTFTIELIEGVGKPKLAYANRNLTPEDYAKSSEKELLFMKMFTWMANLTKRLMNENNLIEDRKDGQFTNLFKDTVDNVSSVFQNNSHIALDFVSSAFAGKYHPQEVALDINKTIEKIMFDYLL